MNELINILNTQAENMNEFFNVVTQQQRAVIENNLSAMEKALQNEVRVLNKISTCESARIDAVKEVSRKLKLNIPDYSLGSFISGCKINNIDGLDKVISLKDLIRDTGNQIVKINGQNKLLIEQSRNLIKDTIAALTGERRILDARI